MQEQHCCENPVEKARPHPHPPRAQPRPRVAGRSRRPLRDEPCPVSTGGGTSLVRLVRGGGGAQRRLRSAAARGDGRIAGAWLARGGAAQGLVCNGRRSDTLPRATSARVRVRC